MAEIGVMSSLKVDTVTATIDVLYPSVHNLIAGLLDDPVVGADKAAEFTDSWYERTGKEQRWALIEASLRTGTELHRGFADAGLAEVLPQGPEEPELDDTIDTGTRDLISSAHQTVVTLWAQAKSDAVTENWLSLAATGRGESGQQTARIRYLLVTTMLLAAAADQMAAAAVAFGMEPAAAWAELSPQILASV
jgi:hypothetical protein